MSVYVVYIAKPTTFQTSKKEPNGVDVLLLNLARIRREKDGGIDKVLEIHKDTKNAKVRVLRSFIVVFKGNSGLL